MGGILQSVDVTLFVVFLKFFECADSCTRWNDHGCGIKVSTLR